MNPQPERRKHARVSADQRLDYVIGRHQGSGRLADISLGGIGLLAPDPSLRKGVQTRVRFQVGSETIETDVEVCHVGEGRRGAFFLNLNDQQRTTLEKLIPQA